MSFQLLVFDSRRGNNEGEEEDKVLGFYPDSTPLNERVSLAGLLQGLHIFSGSLNRPQFSDRFEIIETDSSIWATFEAEDGIFLALAATKTWLPRHVSQENVLGFLMHTHHLMNVLFCGVQYMLEKDETGQLARNSIAHVLKNAGDELLNSTSWVNRELRNPLTTLGHAAILSAPLSITLDVDSLCHRALTVIHDDMQLTENCLVLFNRCVLWSSLRNQDAAALNALCRSSLFPPHHHQSSLLSSGGGSSSTTSPLSLLRGSTPSSHQALTGLSGAASSKQLLQLESGFYVLRKNDDDGTTTTSSSTNLFSLPFVYCESSLKYLLAYGRGDLLILMLGSHPHLSSEALTAIQDAIEPITIQLNTGLAQECQVQGGELGHIPGWRYSVQENTASSSNSSDFETIHSMAGGVRASPRNKVSGMTHHARALATAVTDSLGRLKDTENSVEVCARSTQGVWVVGRQEHQQPPQQRRCVVVREKRVHDGDASQSIASIESSLQSLKLI